MNQENKIIKTFNFGEAAQILNCGLGRNQLYDLLKTYNIIRSDNSPAHEYISMGYFQPYTHKYRTKYNTYKSHKITLVTEEGMNWLKLFVMEDLYFPSNL